MPAIRPVEENLHVVGIDQRACSRSRGGAGRRCRAWIWDHRHVDTRYIDRRIAFDEARQLGALGADVADLEDEIRAEGALDVEVVILRVRQRELGVEREVGERRGELAVDRRIAVERIGEVGSADLLGLQIRRRADGRLKRATLAGVVRLVEDAVGGSDQPFSAAGGIPRETNAWRETLLEGGDQTRGNTAVAGIEQRLRGASGTTVDCRPGMNSVWRFLISV